MGLKSRIFSSSLGKIKNIGNEKSRSCFFKDRDLQIKNARSNKTHRNFWLVSTCLASLFPKSWPRFPVKPFCLDFSPTCLDPTMKKSWRLLAAEVATGTKSRIQATWGSTSRHWWRKNGWSTYLKGLGIKPLLLEVFFLGEVRLTSHHRCVSMMF